MSEQQYVTIEKIVTQELTPLSKLGLEDRMFRGILSAQVKDRQDEIVIIEELEKVLPIWQQRGAPIIDTHTNRIVGEGQGWRRILLSLSDGTEVPAIEITARIFKNYEIDDYIWNSIVTGKYKGLSFGGATKTDREPVQLVGGGIGYNLKNLEHYEVSVCETPANPLSLITDYNQLAKAVTNPNEMKMKSLDGNRVRIDTCTKFQCVVQKGIGDVARDIAVEATNTALEAPLLHRKPIPKIPKKQDDDKSKSDEAILLSQQFMTPDSKMVADKTDKVDGKKEDESPEDKDKEKSNNSIESVMAEVKSLSKNVAGTNTAVLELVNQMKADREERKKVTESAKPAQPETKADDKSKQGPASDNPDDSKVAKPVGDAPQDDKLENKPYNMPEGQVKPEGTDELDLENKSGDDVKKATPRPPMGGVEQDASDRSGIGRAYEDNPIIKAAMRGVPMDDITADIANKGSLTQSVLKSYGRSA